MWLSKNECIHKLVPIRRIGLKQLNFVIFYVNAVKDKVAYQQSINLEKNGCNICHVIHVEL